MFQFLSVVSLLRATVHPEINVRQTSSHLHTAIISQYIKVFIPSKAVHNAGLVKVKAGSDTMIHTPQLKDSLGLN